MELINIENIKLSNSSPISIIAGLNVLENESMAIDVAEQLKKICSDIDIPFIFKASFDKANRSSVESFRGPGLKEGLKIFKENKININMFFAPNHTYDLNTFNALKSVGIFRVIDGYGMLPYTSHEIKFVPQLFYKLYTLPMGIQSTQIHLNYWREEDFEVFSNFVKKNHKNIISADKAFDKSYDGFIYNSINFFLKNLLKFKRSIF